MSVLRKMMPPQRACCLVEWLGKYFCTTLYPAYPSKGEKRVRLEANVTLYWSAAARKTGSGFAELFQVHPDITNSSHKLSFNITISKTSAAYSQSSFILKLIGLIFWVHNQRNHVQFRGWGACLGETAPSA